jgi:drug/metabolite transporter (DMT)-like permease
MSSSFWGSWCQRTPESGPYWLVPKDAEWGSSIGTPKTKVEGLCTGNNLKLVILSATTVVALTANSLVYKIQLVPMERYPLFITWLLAVGYNLLYFPILFFRYRKGIVTPKMFEYAKTIKWDFLKIGISDSCGQVAQIFSARYITGFLLTLLSQGTIPLTILLSLILTKARYSLGQIIGAAILLSGTTLAISPSFAHGASADTLWAIIYFLSSGFGAFSFLTKEKMFSKAPEGGLDIFVVNSFGSLFQLIFTLLLLPIVMLPGLGHVTWNQLPNFLHDSALCYGGISPTPGYDCSLMPWLGFGYIFVNLTVNILFLTLIKSGGAVLGFITGACAFPLQHLIFALPWPRLPALPLEWEDIVALVLSLAGLIVYRYYTLKAKKLLPE